MAYDEHLADRIRELVAGQRGLSEKKMFGGVAFLVRGNMAVAEIGQGGILVRVNPEQSSKLVSTTKAEPMVMRDLQRVCSGCDHKQECADHMAVGDAAQTYRAFCPNAETLTALK